MEGEGRGGGEVAIFLHLIKRVFTLNKNSFKRAISNILLLKKPKEANI